MVALVKGDYLLLPSLILFLTNNFYSKFLQESFTRNLHHENYCMQIGVDKIAGSKITIA